MAELLYGIRRDRQVNRLIVHLQSVTDDELAWYYKNCAFSIYPSMYEGWGLPVAESLSIGKYCIASGATSIPEIGGDLVDYFDPIDYPACYRLVHRAVTDPHYVRLREEQIRAGYRASTWRGTAGQISELADDLLRSPAHACERLTVQQGPQLVA